MLVITAYVRAQYRPLQHVKRKAWPFRLVRIRFPLNNMCRWMPQFNHSVLTTALSCSELQIGKDTLLHDKNCLRNTDPPWVTIKHHIHNLLFNDSDRQAEKLLLWQTGCEWQSWFITVYNHVTGATQALSRGDNSTGPWSSEINTHTHIHLGTHRGVRHRH